MYFSLISEFVLIVLVPFLTSVHTRKNFNLECIFRTCKPPKGGFFSVKGVNKAYYITPLEVQKVNYF